MSLRAYPYKLTATRLEVRLESSGHHASGLQDSDVGLLPVPGAIVCLDSGVTSSDSAKSGKVYGQIEWIHLETGETDVTRETIKETPSSRTVASRAIASIEILQNQILQDVIQWGSYQLTILTPADLHRLSRHWQKRIESPIHFGTPLSGLQDSILDFAQLGTLSIIKNRQDFLNGYNALMQLAHSILPYQRVLVIDPLGVAMPGDGMTYYEAGRNWRLALNRIGGKRFLDAFANTLPELLREAGLKTISVFLPTSTEKFTPFHTLFALEAMGEAPIRNLVLQTLHELDDNGLFADRPEECVALGQGLPTPLSILDLSGLDAHWRGLFFREVLLEALSNAQGDITLALIHPEQYLVDLPNWLQLATEAEITILALRSPQATHPNLQVFQEQTLANNVLTVNAQSQTVSIQGDLTAGLPLVYRLGNTADLPEQEPGLLSENSAGSASRFSEDTHAVPFYDEHLPTSAGDLDFSTLFQTSEHFQETDDSIEHATGRLDAYTTVEPNPVVSPQDVDEETWPSISLEETESPQPDTKAFSDDSLATQPTPAETMDGNALSSPVEPDASTTHVQAEDNATSNATPSDYPHYAPDFFETELFGLSNSGAMPTPAEMEFSGHASPNTRQYDEPPEADEPSTATNVGHASQSPAVSPEIDPFSNDTSHIDFNSDITEIQSFSGDAQEYEFLGSSDQSLWHEKPDSPALLPQPEFTSMPVGFGVSGLSGQESPSAENENVKFLEESSSQQPEQQASYENFEFPTIPALSEQPSGIDDFAFPEVSTNEEFMVKASEEASTQDLEFEFDADASQPHLLPEPPLKRSGTVAEQTDSDDDTFPEFDFDTDLFSGTPMLADPRPANTPLEPLPSIPVAQRDDPDSEEESDEPEPVDNPSAPDRLNDLLSDFGQINLQAPSSDDGWFDFDDNLFDTDLVPVQEPDYRGNALPSTHYGQAPAYPESNSVTQPAYGGYGAAAANEPTAANYSEGLDALYGSATPPTQQHMPTPPSTPTDRENPEIRSRQTAESDTDSTKNDDDDGSFKLGQQVNHPVYGSGKIMKVMPMGDTVILNITFDKVGKRLLDPSLCELTIEG